VTDQLKGFAHMATRTFHGSVTTPAGTALGGFRYDGVCHEIR
jgi:hypothetical protein